MAYKLRGVPKVFATRDQVVSFLRNSPGYRQRQWGYLSTYWPGLAAEFAGGTELPILKGRSDRLRGVKESPGLAGIAVPLGKQAVGLVESGAQKAQTGVNSLVRPTGGRVGLSSTRSGNFAPNDLRQGTEKVSKVVFGKSLTNLASHGDYPKTWGEGAGLAFGLATLVPPAKIGAAGKLALEAGAIAKPSVVRAGTRLATEEVGTVGPRAVEVAKSGPRLAPFHGFGPNDIRIQTERAAKVNRGDVSAGLQANPTMYGTVRGKKVAVLGPLTPQEWTARIKAVIPSRQMRQYYAKWYDAVQPLFHDVFGPEQGDAYMRGFAVSQANASPTTGMQAVLRITDKLRRGEQVTNAEISTVAESIATAFGGKEEVRAGVAAKLSDFVDSIAHSPTRTYTGHDLAGGRPVAVDVHALRDQGYVDPKIAARLEKNFGLKANEHYSFDSDGTASGYKYEQVRKQYETLTDHLNRTGFDGRRDWTPAEVQALGWSGIQVMHGVVPEDLAMAFERNTRRISSELAFGEGSPLEAQYGKAWSALDYGQREQATKYVYDAILPQVEKVFQPGSALTRTQYGLGMYEGTTSPSVLIDVLGSAQTVESIADSIGYLTQQSEVWSARKVFSPYTRDAIAGDVKSSKGVEAILPDATPEQFQAFARELQKEKAIVGLQALPESNGVRILEHPEYPWTPKEKAAIRQAVEDAAERADVTVRADDRVLFELRRQTHDWQADPTGASYLERLGAREPAAVDRIRALGANVPRLAEAALGRARSVGSATADAARRLVSEEAASFNPFAFRRGAVEAAPPPPVGAAGPMTEDVAVQQALKEAPAVRAAQEAGYSKERGLRAIAASEAFEKAGGGSAGLKAVLGELQGELPKIDYEGFTEFTPQAFESMVNRVWDHPNLLFYEKLRAMVGLRKATEGVTPQASELKLIARVFGDANAKALGDVKNTGIMAWLKHYGLDLWNLPRSLQASIDLSAPFRQGLVAGARHPAIFAKNFKPMIQALRSDANAEAIMHEILSRDNAPLYQKAKLAVTETHGADIAKREEAFPSPMADYVPGVKGSGRAYTVFLNKMRADIFDYNIALAEKHGRNINDPHFLSSLGEFINTATGRGRLPGKTTEQAATFLNSFLFSPRLLASRFQMLNPHYYWKLAPGVRRQAVQASMQTLGGILGFLTLASQIPGWSVGLDPRSANFGKIRIGDTRIDVAGGFLPLLVLYSRLVKGQSVSSSSGKLTTYSGKFGDTNQWDVMQRFLEGKMAPTPGLVRDIAKHQTFIGKPVTVKGELQSMLVPLNIQGVRETYQTEHSVPLTAASAVLGGIGFGVQSYHNTPLKSSGGSATRSARGGRGGRPSTSRPSSGRPSSGRPSSARP